MNANMTFNSDASYYGEHAATLGDRIVAGREALGFSQSDLAHRMGVKLKTLQAWENDHSDPRANKVQMLAGLLGVSITWLLNGEGDGIPAPTDEVAGMPDGLQDILDELRQLQDEMAQNAKRVGHIEKRLRLVKR
jgi:transcriptional regulator with XRE-family HTH domain